MASNIPLGSFFEDGARVGPLYSGEIPNGTGADSLVPFNTSEVLSYSSYSAYGPGILLSSQNTWNITPAPTGNANIVGRTNVTPLTNLTLLGDNVATRLISQSNTPTYTQFDWPRVPTVTISGANLAGPISVTILGYDFYGIPMQHTYVVQNIGTYPINPDGSFSVPAKAFYSVSQVLLNTPLTNGAFISVGASDVFGLPFLVNNAGDITSIGWGNGSDLEDNSASVSSPILGTATLVNAGSVTVPCNSITVNSNIQVTRKTVVGAEGNISVPSANRVANTSFQIATTGAETSTVDWMVTNPSGQYSAAGVTPLVAGVVTIETSQVQSNSNIQLSMDTFGAAHGQWYVSAIVPGVSFTVTSTGAGAGADTSTVAWTIMPQNLAQGTSNALGSDALNPQPGKIFVNAPSVTANSNILLTYATNPAGNGGVLSAPGVTDPVTPQTILPGEGFWIVSSNVADTARVNWVITNLLPNLTQGTSTLAAGTVTVPTTSVAANSVILLTYNTFSTQGTYIEARTADIVPGTSFIITSQNGADVSTVDWAIFPANFFLSNFVAPLGTFVGADQTFPPTAATGDVRGLYGPSTPSNGVNVLRFTSYVQGADQWINQVSNNQFLEKALSQPVVGTTINPLTPQELYGYPQFYTGTNS